MKKKLIIPAIIVLIILLVTGWILLFPKKEYQDENTLYSTNFGTITLRIERYDYSLGQNQIVGVEKSIDGGKNYEILTSEPITISMEAKFTFLDENLGFIISKPNLSKSNNYMGVKVTQDGGRTFINGVINYDNPDIEILTVTSVPYKNGNLLILPCSIYQIKEDKSGYETINIVFVSTDNGLSWNEKKVSDEKVNNVKVIINDKTYLLNLDNNMTVDEFIDLLPQEFNMSELNGNEKYVYMKKSLITNSYNPGHVEKGDVYLYSDNCLVIFYKSFNTSYYYTKIGHIDNLPDLGDGNIIVKFEK